MSESSNESRRFEGAPVNRWNPEQLTEARLNALLPYTELETIEDFKSVLDTLAGVLAKLSVRNNRNRFLPRYGGPTKWEYILYGQGRLVGQEFEIVKRCLEDLGIVTAPIDELDRDFVVIQERGKTTLELLGLVAGRNPDEEMSEMQGANWGAIAAAAMEKAAQEDSSEDIPVVRRSYRSFPLKGSDTMQRLHSELRRHFMESTRPEVSEGDPVELDELIDDTAIRFEDGSLSLDQAFQEWGIDVEEDSGDERVSVPSGKPLGEVLYPETNKKYRWRSGVLYKKDSRGSAEVLPVPKEDLLLVYSRAKPAAELLWDADALTKKAERIVTLQSSYQKSKAEAMAAKWRAEAEDKRKQADTMPDSLQAIAEAIDIHRGYVFTRVMRFLKRRDVRMASSFGPKDLLQEGTLGLYRALARFENDETGSFIGYARHHIDGTMLAFVLQHRTFMRLPPRIQQTLNQIYDIDDKADVIPDAGDTISMSPDVRRGRRLALAESIFGRKFNIGTFLDAKRREVHHDDASFRVPVSDMDDASTPAVDMWAEDLRVHPETQRLDFENTKSLITQLLMSKLTTVEERVIRALYGIGTLESDNEHEITLKETGKRVGGSSGAPVTQERVRQIEAKALRKLKYVITRRFGKLDAGGDKYIDISVLASIFDIQA